MSQRVFRLKLSYSWFFINQLLNKIHTIFFFNAGVSHVLSPHLQILLYPVLTGEYLVAIFFIFLRYFCLFVLMNEGNETANDQHDTAEKPVLIVDCYNLV